MKRAPRAARRGVMATVGVVLAVLAGALAYRSRHVLVPPEDRRVAEPDDRASMLPAGQPIRLLSPQPIGNPFTAKERPLVAHVTTVDLGPGRPRSTSSPATWRRIGWCGSASLRAGPSPKRRSAPKSARPAHAEAVDLDGDGDLDLVVASLGVMFPSNAKIGSVVVLENDGHGRFTNRVLVDRDRARRRRPRRRFRRRRRSRPRGRRVRLRRWGDAVDGEPGQLAIHEHACSRICRDRSTWRSSISTATAISTSRRS